MIIETKQKHFFKRLLIYEYLNNKITLKISINGLNIISIIFLKVINDIYHQIFDYL
jgi:hypothetical protein